MSHQSGIRNERFAGGWIATAKLQIPLICLGLVVMVCVIYGQTIQHDFLILDDDYYVTNNGHVSMGLTWENICWAMTAGVGNHLDTDYWMPLSLISHMADVTLFGMHATGHHTVNVLLQALNSALLFLLLKSMTGSLWRSALVTALWAVHPLRVESVAWISERKDLLGGLFFILSLAAYLRYVRRPSPGSSLLVLLPFTMGLMSKPILVPLPFLLIVLDYWPLNRLSDQTARSRFVALMREKWPLFALSILSCLVTLLSQEQALNPEGQAPLMVKAGNALIATTIYLGKMVWPVGLAAYYPFPSHGWSCWQVIPCLILLVAVTVAVMILRRSRPYLAVGWFWYLVMLAPASGIIQAGAQAYADRFTYLPQIGLWIALVWLLADLAGSHKGQLALGLLSLLVMAALSYASYRQAMYWRDNNTLMIRTLQNTTENRFAHLSLADSLLKNGQLDEALNEYLRSSNVHPRDFENDAEKIRRILQSQPDDQLLSYKLGEWLVKKGDRATAIQLLEFSHNLDKSNPATMNDLSWILSTAPEPGLRNGLRGLKLAQEAVLMLGSNNPAPLDTLAVAYAETGDFVKALEIEKRALKLAEAVGNNILSSALRKRIDHFEQGQPCRDPE